MRVFRFWQALVFVDIDRPPLRIWQVFGGPRSPEKRKKAILRRHTNE